MATNETENPDLRDRAYIYWRLLVNKLFNIRFIIFLFNFLILNIYLFLRTMMLNLQRK